MILVLGCQIVIPGIDQGCVAQPVSDAPLDAQPYGTQPSGVQPAYTPASAQGAPPAFQPYSQGAIQRQPGQAPPSGIMPYVPAGHSTPPGAHPYVPARATAGAPSTGSPQTGAYPATPGSQQAAPVAYPATPASSTVQAPPPPSYYGAPPAHPPSGPAPYYASPPPARSWPSDRASFNRMGRELLLKGREALDAGNTPLALQMFQEVARMKPLDPNPTYWIGVIHEKTENWQSAVETYAQAIKQCTALGMDSAQVRINLGNVLSRMKYIKEAEYDYRRALEIDEKNQAAHLNLGRLLLSKGEHQQAFDQFRRCSELGVTDPALPLYSALALYGLGKKTDAQSQLEVFLQRAESSQFDPKVISMAKDLMTHLKVGGEGAGENGVAPTGSQMQAGGHFLRERQEPQNEAPGTSDKNAKQPN